MTKEEKGEQVKRVICSDGSMTMLIDDMFLHPPKYGAHHSVDVHVTPIASLLSGNVRVLDIGFGTGWTVAALIDECIRRNCTLDLIGIEKSKEVYEQRLTLHPPFDAHKYVRGEQREGLHVNVIIDDATNIITTLGTFNIILLDGWNEHKTPELYSEDFLKKCYDALKQNGAITVNTGSWNVKDNLVKAGFKVETIAHKEYESLVGRK